MRPSWYPQGQAPVCRKLKETRRVSQLATGTLGRQVNVTKDEANVSRVRILSCTHHHHPGHNCKGLIPFSSVAGSECMHCSEGLLCCLIACVGFWSGTTRANCTLVASSTERTDIGTSNPFYLPQLCLTLDKEKAHPRLDQRNATVGWICEDNKCHPMQCHATGLLLRWKVTKARWCAALEASLLIGCGRWGG